MALSQALPGRLTNPMYLQVKLYRITALVPPATMRKTLCTRSVKLEIRDCTVLGAPTPRTSRMACLSALNEERPSLTMVLPLAYQ